MTDWLEFLRSHIKSRRDTLAGVRKPPLPFDERIDHLAAQALTFLREDPATAADVALPVTTITNGVGNRISKYAFVGSLGPDLPAAGYVLALNQDWAWHTLHNGEPRRARVNARSTTFVLKLLDIAEKDEKEGRLTRAQRRRIVSYAIGHLSHIATDVVLHPAIHQLAWAKPRGPLDPLEHKLIEVAIDARMAQGFYKRQNLYDDIQSWEDYYLDKGDFKADLTLLMGKLGEAFKATYGDDRPMEHLCGLEDPKKCGAPKFDADFLMDAYRNTTNWAIDEGYDHSPDGMDTLWWVTVLASAMISAISLAGSTKSFGTITNLLFGANQGDVTFLTDKAFKEWQDDGTASLDVWRDIIDKSISWADNVAIPYEWLFGGGFAMAIITFGQAGDGLFGRDEGVENNNPWFRTVNKVVTGIKPIAFFVLEEAVPRDLTERPGWKWFWFFFDGVHDLLEHFGVNYESRQDNYSGERLENATWVPKKILAASNFLGNALMMIWKSERKALTTNDRANGIEPPDFVFPFIFANITCAIFVWTGMWRDHLLFHTTKSHWPLADTKPVASFLPLPTTSGGRNAFDSATAEKLHVRLFPDNQLKRDGFDVYYPDGGGAARDINGQTARDLAARKLVLNAHTDAEYRLPDLLDHAARFSGLLAMAAVAYNEAAAPVRQHVTGIFKDWNLDFASFEQWNDLFKPSAQADMGLLNAAEIYTKDLDAFTQPHNELAIARLRSTLGVTDLAGGLLADFAHQRVAMGAIQEETASALRLTRPGAALMPNVDVDTPAPSPLAAPLPTRAGDLDALRDDKINTEGNDAKELTELRVRKPAEPGSPHTLVLRLHAADASRVRVFEKNEATPPDTWPVVLGFTSTGVKHEYEIPVTALAMTDYLIEVKGFAGDPGMPAPTGPGPLSPSPFAIGAASPGSPVVTERRESDVWIEMIHKDGGIEVPGIRDVALFGVAPLLLLSNLRKAEQLYASYLPDQWDGPRLLRAGNYPFVTDIVRALRSDTNLAPRVKVRTLQIGTFEDYMPHQPVRKGDPNEAGALYIIDGMTYGHWVPLGGSFPDVFINDGWVQDEFEIGYSESSLSWMHVVLHSPRNRELAKFVENELPSVDVGLFNGASGGPESGISFGGNVEVSPAVTVPTPAQTAGAAGPEVPAQPASPLGKIILGEGTPFLFDVAERFGAELQAKTVSDALVTEMGGHNTIVTTADTVEIRVADREWLIDTTGWQTLLVKREAGKLKVHLARLAKKEFKHFLEAQHAQPVVTVDTSWLNVGHVDEIFIFVPATKGGKPFRLLMASSKLGIDLLQQAQFLAANESAPMTECFRGRKWLKPRPGRATNDAVEPVSMTLTTHGEFNRKLQTLRLTPIEDRLKATLGLDAADVIRVPVLYDFLPTNLMDQLGALVLNHSAPGGFYKMRTAAYTPCAVNLQVFDNIALVPRQHGPRMRPADVVKVFEKAGFPGVKLDALPPTGNEQWVRGGTTAASLATTFKSSAAAIRGDARNAGKLTPAGAVKLDWDLITIPEDNVDLFEAFTHAQLKALGLSVHFVEDWDEYHVSEGEVHCGTNVRRTPVEADVNYTGPRWWDCDSVKG